MSSRGCGLGLAATIQAMYHLRLRLNQSIILTALSQQVISPGVTLIRIPFSTTFKQSQLNWKSSYECRRRFPDVLWLHPGSGHPMDSGWWFNNAKDSNASSWQNLTLNRLDVCNGCDGHDGPNGCVRCDGYPSCSVELHGYIRLPEPNNTSTEHVRVEYGVQFGSCAGWVRVSIGSTPLEELRSTPIDKFRSTLASSRGVRVNISIIRMCSKLFHHR